MIRQGKKMTLHRIKTLLYMKKIKPAMIAELARVSPITVRGILNGNGTSRNIQQTIADLLNRPYERLWGSSDQHKAIITNKKRAVND